VCLRVKPGKVTVGYDQIRVPALAAAWPRLLHQPHGPGRRPRRGALPRACARDTRSRYSDASPGMVQPPADRDDAMPFPSGIRTTTGAPSSIVTTCANAKLRCAEGSACWRFADPGKTSTGAEVAARL